MAYVEVTIQGYQATRDQIERVNRALGPASLLGFLESVAQTIQRGTMQDRFARESGPGGAEWAPLAYMTQEERERKNFGAEHPILQRTGDLLGFMTAGGEARAVSNAAEMTWPRRGAPFVEKKYSVNQFGGKSQLGFDVPARPMLGWDEMDLAKMMVGLENWFRVVSGVSVNA